jgi:hypothetical protein
LIVLRGGAQDASILREPTTARPELAIDRRREPRRLTAWDELPQAAYDDEKVLMGAVQALYHFKNASARFIRELHAADEYDNFELPFCSRCPAVVVDAVDDVIAAAKDRDTSTAALRSRSSVSCRTSER